jgi:hypothetical protein
MPELTTDQWREQLDAELSARLTRIERYERYYDGDHDSIIYSTAKFREAFGEMFKGFATNWCGLVVDVAAERLQILGFRFGEDEADEESWRIWQSNNLDARSLQAHTQAIKAETGYLLVTAPPRPEMEPRITVEHPNQMIVAHDPSDRRIRLAAFKRYRAKNGDLVNVVWEPETITTYRRRDVVQRAFSGLEALGVYLPTPNLGSQWDSRVQVPNRLGRVPVVPLENAPHLLTGGTSDLKPAIALNDAANKFFTDMIHASEFSSFPQRVLTGVELPRDPITNEVSQEAQIRSAINRIWAFESPDARVQELQIGSLENYVQGFDSAIQHLAAQTRTPPHYLLAKLVNLSGDALNVAETGLNARCRRKHLDFSDPWEEAMRLCFLWRSIYRSGWVGADEDAYRAGLEDAETIWVDPEHKDPIALSQSLTNKKTIGVPDEMLWAGSSPRASSRPRTVRP